MKCYIIVAERGCHEDKQQWNVAVTLQEAAALNKLNELRVNEIKLLQSFLNKNGYNKDDTYYEIEEHEIIE